MMITKIFFISIGLVIIIFFAVHQQYVGIAAPPVPVPCFTIKNLDYPGVDVTTDSGAKRGGSNFQFNASCSTSTDSLQFRWNFDGGGWDTVWLSDPFHTQELAPSIRDPGATNRHEKNIILEVKNASNQAQITRTIYLYYLDIEAWFPASGVAPFTPASSIRFYVDNELSTPTPWSGEFEVLCLNGELQGCHNLSRIGCQGDFFSKCMPGGYWGDVDCEETKAEGSSSIYTTRMTYGDISCSSYTTPGNAGITLTIRGVTRSGVSIGITKTISITITPAPPSFAPSTRLIATGSSLQDNVEARETDGIITYDVLSTDPIDFGGMIWDCDDTADISGKDAGPLLDDGWLMNPDPASNPLGSYEDTEGIITCSSGEKSSYLLSKKDLTFSSDATLYIKAFDGTIWSTSTIQVIVQAPANQPPTCPTVYTPLSGSTNISTDQDISWSGASDPESNPLTYDVHFGTINPPPFQINQVTTTYEPGALNYNTTYYWKVKVKDGTNTTDCAVQNFTTKADPCTQPNCPAVPCCDSWINQGCKQDSRCKTVCNYQGNYCWHQTRICQNDCNIEFACIQDIACYKDSDCGALQKCINPGTCDAECKTIIIPKSWREILPKF